MANQVWAIMMVRDEEDIIAYTLQHLISEGVSGIILGDHQSVDTTFSRAAEVAVQNPQVPIYPVKVEEPGYYQSVIMTQLMQLAIDAGATHILPCDADELWYSPDGRQVTEVISENDGAVAAVCYNHCETGLDDHNIENPFERMLYRWDMIHCRRIAFKTFPGAIITQGNHGVLVRGKSLPQRDLLAVRHYPWRGFDQFLHKTKVAGESLAKTKGLPQVFGGHWRGYKNILDAGGVFALRALYDSWFFYKDPLPNGLLLDPAPYCKTSKRRKRK